MRTQRSASPLLRRARKRSGASGFTLLELILSVVIIATVLLPLSDAVTRATLGYTEGRNGVTGHDIAHRIMNTLACEELPSFGEEEEASAIVPGEGTYYDFLERVSPDELNTMSYLQQEEAARWRFEYTKELVVINKDGAYGPDEEGLEPDFGQFSDENYDEDDINAPTPAEDLAKLVAARVIRIRLTLWLPTSGENGEFEPEYAEGDRRATEAGDPRKIVLVTFVDADDFKEEPNRNTKTTNDTAGATSSTPSRGSSASAARSGRGRRDAK